MKVLTVGTFDLYHRGHAFLLAQARRLAGDGQVIVGVNTDEFVKAFKRERPIQNFGERASVLASVRYVDEIIRNDDSCLRSLLSVIAPDILLIGQDWALKNYYGQIGVSQEWLDEKNISLFYVPRPGGSPSSTELKARMKQQDTGALYAEAAAEAALPLPAHAKYTP